MENQSTIWRVSGDYTGSQLYVFRIWAERKYRQLERSGQSNARLEYLTGEWKQADAN